MRVDPDRAPQRDQRDPKAAKVQSWYASAIIQERCVPGHTLAARMYYIKLIEVGFLGERTDESKGKSILVSRGNCLASFFPWRGMYGSADFLSRSD